MRILLNGLTQRPGGGLVILEALVSGISRYAGVDQIIVLVYDDTVYDALTSLEFSNIQVIKLRRITNLLGKLLVPVRIRKAASDYKCNVLLTLNFYVPGIPVKQIVYHVDLERFEYHSLWPPRLQSLHEKIRDKSAARALIHADANVFESEFLLSAAVASSCRPVNNPSVIYIGINELSLSDLLSKVRSINDSLIVTVTSPQKYKNNEALIPLLQELKECVPTVSWKIRVFGGSDITVWNDLVQLAHAAGVDGCFEFMGYQNKSILNKSIDSAICLVNMSRLESFCMVALEAMSRGCPVIVSPHAAMPESVGEAGIVVDPDDSITIVDKILELRENNVERLAIENASINWARGFTWEKSGNKFYKLCHEMLINK